MNPITITTAQPHHAQAMSDLICLAYSVPLEVCDGHEIPSGKQLAIHISRFPEGQFIALEGEKIVGAAITLLTRHQPTEPPLKWMEVLGDLTGKNHDPHGDWMYGFEFVVDPAYRKQGIGILLYEARFAYLKARNLKGYYAGGMLMGYYRYRDQLTPLEYGEKVKAREIIDPTVTMQMNRGFKPLQVIENYLDEEAAGNAAMMIVWENPDYQPSDN